MVLFSDDDEDVNLEKIDISGLMPKDEDAANPVKSGDTAMVKSEIVEEEEPPLVTVDEVIKKDKHVDITENKVIREDKSLDAAEGKARKKTGISIPVIRSSDQIPTGQQIEVEGMLTELDEIEEYLGMLSRFDDIKFPEPRPVILPRVEQPMPAMMPQQVVQQPVYAKLDASKLDDEQLDMLLRKLNRVDELAKQVEDLKNVIDERLNVDFVAMYENILEKNNIEAIKTYRNVQAVIVEENAKQNRALFGIDGKSDSLKRRLNNVIVFSIISFVVSILVMLMQILPALGIEIF